MNKSKLIDLIGQFTTIPNTVIRMWPDIENDGMALFMYLRYRTNSTTEEAFPSYDTIKRDTGMGRERIAKAIRRLEKAGLVERKKRFGQSTVYTLKLPDVPVVGNPDYSSSESRLSVVGKSDTNYTESIKTESIKIDGSAVPVYSTREIQKAYENCVPYKIDWAKNEGHAAKWLAENGYTPDDITACYADLKAQKFWSDKPLNLSSIKKQIGEWKARKTGKGKVIKLVNVVMA